MRLLLITLFLSVTALSWAGAQDICDTLTVSDDIRLVKLAEDIYMHVSEEDFGRYGRVSSNGLIVISNGEAIMIDTPANDVQTERLTRFVADKLNARVSLLIPTHWHDDCMGGINFIHSHGAESVAFEMTREIAAANGLTVPRTGFEEPLRIGSEGRSIELYWPGGGHSLDNIVVWIPGERILFGGCLVKDLDATNLGNTADGDVEAWPQSIRNLITRYPDAVTIIPGHGKPGGPALLDHTLELLKAAAE